MTLDELAIKHGTDKASIHPTIVGHGYTFHYERFFEPLRNQPIKLLEIGVGGAHSIELWLEYFPLGKIFGLDNVKDTNPYNTVGEPANPRYTFVCGDQSDLVLWKCFAVDYGADFDIVIDDGGHFANQVITTWHGGWPLVKAGGFFAVEDLAVAYGSLFVPPGWQNHMDFIKDKLDAINRSQDEIGFLYFSKELAIFQKAIPRAILPQSS